MTPHEKAKELVAKFTTFHPVGYAEEITPDIYTAKKHAKIAVEEILNLYWSHNSNEQVFWQKVKNEIKML